MLVQKADSPVLSRIPNLDELGTGQEITLEDEESYMYMSKLKQPLEKELPVELSAWLSGVQPVKA